jgi:hypothetical protein
MDSSLYKEGSLAVQLPESYGQLVSSTLTKVVVFVLFLVRLTGCADSGTPDQTPVD